jgi:hypothetical protein
MMMYLRVGDRTATIEVTREGEVTSPHSGRRLRRREGRTGTADPAIHEEFSDAIDGQGPEGFQEIGPAGDLGRWKVKRDSYSISNGHFTHSLIMTETENLIPDALIIDGMEFHPTRYEEEVQQGELQVRARFLTTKENSEALRKIMRERRFFPVIRRGINDQPVQLRFGMCGWSEHPEGFKHSVFMLDGKYDDNDSRQGNHISEVRADSRDNAVAASFGLFRELLPLLKEKGILTEDEITGLRSRAAERLEEIHQSWFKVKDVDDLAW